MKNTALMALPKVSVTKVSKKAIVKSLPSMEQLTQGDGIVDKLWDMYQKQLKRTHEMMVLCDALQKENEELKHNQKLVEQDVTEKKPKEEKEKRLQPIGYDKLKELTGYLRVIFQSKMERTEYANALAHMIYTLYQLKGQATPDQLFASADLTEVSGYRYASFFKKAKMIRYSPTNKKGYYVLTDTGKAFVEGKITTDEEFCKAIEIEKDLMYRFRR